MRKILLPLAVLLCGAGCVVQSLQPWLSDETRVDEPSLLGTWHDAKEKATAFFSESDDSNYDYNVLMVTDNKNTARFTASLHKLDEQYVLTVGPDDPDNLNGVVLLPGYLLLKVELDVDSLKLYGIELDTFRERAEKAQVTLVPESKDSGDILAGGTAEVEAFVRAQLADPEFFDAKPLYSFRKLPAATP